MSVRKRIRGRSGLGVSSLAILLAVFATSLVESAVAADAANSDVARPATRQGICVVLGFSGADGQALVVDRSKLLECVVYFQSPDAKQVAAVREDARQANLLGTRVFARQGDWNSLHLADNLADAVLVDSAVINDVDRKEIFRVLRPGGQTNVANENGSKTKPVPDGFDEWSHPYHTPDNNPQSTDQFARTPYLTQFLAKPKFSPMPEVTVAAGGRIFKAMGHIAHKANQNPWLNTLLGINAYNGTVLWERKLPSGFMIHRNTMIATPEYLYLGDHESCKRIDAGSGLIRDEITLPDGLADGPTWKWMALRDGVLYALVGNKEFTPPTQPSPNQGLGHWPWGMWPGHDYADPRKAFGFGRTFVAIDAATKEVLWSHRDEDYLDSRGVCLNNDRLFFYCPEKFLACLDIKTGQILWKNNSADLLAAIGPNQRAQHYVTGYSTTTYIKCNDECIFFAGPQRNRLVVASTDAGSLLWHKEHGNLQLVLRDDGFYAAGPGETGAKLSYDDGSILAKLPVRRACTRATGTLDSVFYRTPGGTVRVETATNAAKHIAPMRPPCQDGVIVSNGMLYWGPWMCGCQLSFYGHIGLASAGDFDFDAMLDASRFEAAQGGSAAVKPLEIQAGDWPTFCGDNARSMAARASLPRTAESKWTAAISPGVGLTAPVTAGGLTFVASRNGSVQAVDAANGKLVWRAYTGGAVYFPPAIWNGRAYVGSADGHVYAFEAATGRQLWRYRAAPAERLISVYGSLVSTWPVAGGVVVDDGVVYAAAGIAHYDGTHVFALDAVTGDVKWYNGSSGTHSKADSGVSLQGFLYVRDGELRFLGGGVHEVARYDLNTGKCLNPPNDVPRSTFHTAFYPYYPEYGAYLSLDHTFDDGRRLEYDASYEGAVHGNLALLPAGAPRPAKPESRWGYLRRRGQQQQQVVWKDRNQDRFRGFAVTKDVVIAAGDRASDRGPAAFVAAKNVSDGTEIWRQELPSTLAQGGVAVDHDGRVFVALENGELMCIAGE